ncbi:MAG TPA: hypothetical protein VKB86_17515, partial [Pyrinomonadaceae bacterium]|nr:hypothetical protein [Pyrinomonadaceae bacterium]
LEDRFGIHEKDIQLFIDAVDELNQWTTILSTVEAGVRIGIQVVACGSPPGLGCLWGLVAQIGIGPALDLLADTEYFENHIARPTAQQLMDAIAGDALRGLVAETVKAVGLEKYAEGVDACMPRKRFDVSRMEGFSGTFDPNAPNVRQARAAWEKKYHDEIVKDLLNKFDHGKAAKSMTEEDLKKLLEQMKKANLSQEEMKKAFERAKDKDTGKINVDAATSELQKGGGAEGAGEGKAGEGGVIDAGKAKDDLPAGLKPSKDISGTVHTESGHTKGTNVLLTIDLFMKGEYLVTIINLPAKVADRTWYDEKKKYLKISYKLSKVISLAPFAPNYYLTGDSGRQVYGSLKYGI